MVDRLTDMNTTLGQIEAELLRRKSVALVHALDQVVGDEEGDVDGETGNDDDEGDASGK
jgi:hypothetical protein